MAPKTPQRFTIERSTQMLFASSLARSSDRASGAGAGWWDAPWRIRRPWLARAWRARFPGPAPAKPLARLLAPLPGALGQILPGLGCLLPLLKSSPQPANLSR